jgi:hypothetical protein
MVASMILLTDEEQRFRFATHWVTFHAFGGS